MRRACFSFVVVCYACAALNARAQDQATTSAWEVRLEVDLPVTAIAAVGAGTWLLGDQLAPPYCAPICDSTALWSIDEGVAGRWDPSWSTASDVGVGVMLAGSLLVAFADRPNESFLSDGLVLVETILVTNALSSLFGVATRRPRPFVYGENAPLDERVRGTASLSFFSGHTANSFAAATALFWTLRERHPREAWPWLVWGVGLVGASFVGVGRVLSGQHFPTDVLAGALAGIGTGIVIPELHRRAPVVMPIAFEQGVGMGVGARF